MNHNILYLRMALASLLIFSVNLAHASVPILEQLKWKNRVIVLLASEGDPQLAEQKARLNAKSDAVKERDLKILEETDPAGPLHRNFKPKTPFSAFLIGKDGGVKWQSSEVLDPKMVFDKIDSMPMRADEKRK